MARKLSYYTDEEVVGSSSKYHRTSCPIIRQIHPLNHKRLQSPHTAEDLGLVPCRVCKPFSSRAKRLPITSEKPPVERIYMPAYSSRPKRLPITSVTVTDRTDESKTVSTAQLAEMRHALIRLIAAVDKGEVQAQHESVAARIARLTLAGAIPREVAPLMRTITEMRNVAEYESKTLSMKESAAVSAAWAVIQEWAREKGLDSKERT